MGSKILLNPHPNPPLSPFNKGGGRGIGERGGFRAPGCKNHDRPGVKHNEQPSPSLLRAIRLEELVKSGCTFRLEDLAPADWLCLEALREGREIVAQEAQKRREAEGEGHE